MSRLIIENRSSLSDAECLGRVQTIIDGGRVSNDGKQYCYYSVFNDDIGVATFLNKASDRFVITNTRLKR